MTLAELFKKYQDLYKLSDADLARRLSVSQSSICRWNNGSRQPSLKMLRRIAKHTGFDIAELVNATDRHKPCDLLRSQ